ncbi:MAG: flagellar basal body rod protein FlgB [Spirochaetia bacterium]
MFLNNSFGRSVDILHRSMDVSLLRRNVTADNIANADTPNFKRSEVNFESELRRAIETENDRTMEARATDPRHISFNRPVDYRTVRPAVRLDHLTTTDNNGNNVDAEVESMNLLENELMYTMMIRMVNHQFQQVNSVLA